MFQKIFSYYQKHSIHYKNFLDQKLKGLMYSEVVYKWIKVFIKILNTLMYIDSVTMYEYSEFPNGLSCKKFIFDESKEISKMQNSILINERRLPNLLDTPKEINADMQSSKTINQRKSFTNLPLNDNILEIRNKMDKNMN